jgi:DNA-binding response OmpR family regulator
MGSGAIAAKRRVLWLGSPGRSQDTRGVDLESSLQLHQVTLGYLHSRGLSTRWWPAWPAAALNLQAQDVMVLALGHGNAAALQQVRQQEAQQAGTGAWVAPLPVVWMSAGDDVDEQVQALNAGADACIAWPVSPRELSLRLESLVRRAQGGRPAAPAQAAQAPHGVLRFGSWELDLDTRRLCAPTGLVVVLTLTEFRLLRAFLTQPRHVLSRDELLSHARGREVDVFDRSIDLLISRLRHKLDDDPREPRYIRTVRGVGYLFDAFGV